MKCGSVWARGMPRRRTTCSDSWHDWSQYVTITYVEETTNWLVFHKNKRRYTVLLDILPNRLVSHLYHFYRICITIFHEVKKIISNLTNILIAKVFERMSKKKKWNMVFTLTFKNLAIFWVLLKIIFIWRDRHFICL